MISYKLVISLLWGIVWLLSGLILNILQLMLYLLVKPFNADVYRSLNYYLTYSSWSQVVVLAEVLSGSRVRVFYADADSEKYFGSEHTICVSNHKYETDWLYSWMVVDKLSCLGTAKGVAKKSLKLMPVMGWCWFFCEFIFLARNWDEDKLILGQALDTFMEYLHPVIILLFCEGTRFTPDKYAASVDFAKSKGIHYFKYHLVPRTRGFVHMIKHLKRTDKLKSVVNVQLAFHPDNNNGLKANLYNILNGHPSIGDMYIERIPMDRIDASSDESISQFLMDMYKKKDELMEYHEKYAKFPGEYKIFKPRLASWVNWCFWFLLIIGSQFYSLRFLILNEYYISVGIYALIFVLGVYGLTKMAGTTRAKKGSSYGGSPNRVTDSPKTNGSSEGMQINGQKGNSDDDVLQATLTNGKAKVAYANTE